MQIFMGAHAAEEKWSSVVIISIADPIALWFHKFMIQIVSAASVKCDSNVEKVAFSISIFPCILGLTNTNSSKMFSVWMHREQSPARI